MGNNKLQYIFYILVTVVIVIIFILNAKNVYSFKNVLFKPTLLVKEDEFTDEEKTKTTETHRVSAKHYVFISSTFDENYTFNLPVVVHSWRRLNIEPVIAIIYDDVHFKYKENSSAAHVIKYLEKINIRIISLNVDQNNSIVISQVIRLFGGILSNDILNDQDFLMTSDSELAPLKLNYYHVNLNTSNPKITLWNAFCCGSFSFENKMYEMYPIGHIGMTKKEWRDVMELNFDDYKFDGASVLKKLREFFGKSFKQTEGKGSSSWYADQTMVSVRIKRYTEEKNLIPEKRAYTGVRLDRTTNENYWNNRLKKSDEITDVHLYQWQCKSFIMLFNNFLNKLFANEISLISFYKDLQLNFWQF